jgi:dipeptidyl aminopeptidase/acylaminoacyl peptidase
MKCVRELLCAALCFVQGGSAFAQAILEPNKNLRVGGIPAIPTALAQTLEAYTDVKPTSVVAWHPTDGSLTVLRRASQSAQLFSVSKADGALAQLTDFAEPVRSAQWEPTAGRYLLIARDRGGNEANQIFRYHPDSKEAVQLTDDNERNAMGPWNRSRTRLLVMATPLDKTGKKDPEVHIRAVDPLAPEKAERLLTIPGAGYFPVLWREAQKKLWVNQYISATEQKLWEYDLATGDRKELPEMEVSDWDDEQGAEESARIFVRRYDEGKGEFRKLYRLDVSSRKLTPVSEAVNWDVSTWQRSPNGDWLAYVTNEAGRSVLRVVNASTLEPMPVPALLAAQNAMQIDRLRWHPTAPQLAVTMMNPNLPSDVVVIDFDKQTITPWTDSRPTRIDKPLRTTAQLVEWKSFDDRMISGFMYRPAADFTGPRPVIINIHGGPEAQSRPSFLGRWHYYLNELGAVLIFPNVRGSRGFGKTFLTLDNGVLREDSVKDIGALLTWIKSQKDLDANRVAVVGGSYGGYMSLAVSTHYSEQIRCAVDAVGISNFVSFLERTETYRRDLRRSEYGDERDPTMRAHLTAISPLTNAQKIKKPLFVVHGINDPRVPFAEAEQIVEKVRGNGTKVWTLYADNEGHGFAKKANADYLFYAQTMFFKECFQ